LAPIPSFWTGTEGNNSQLKQVRPRSIDLGAFVFSNQRALSGGFAPEELVLLFAAAVGATEAAKKQHTNAYSDEHCKNSSKRK
jgi:hypothetical protein